MTTPQRALELADLCRKMADGHLVVDKLTKRSWVTAMLELESVARHYAEIMQAEVVGTTIEVPRHENASFGVFDKNVAPNGTKLIIKPKPLP